MKHEWRIPFFLILRHMRRGSKWTLALIIFLMAIAFVNMVFVTSLFNGIVAISDTKIKETFAGNITIFPSVGDDFLDNASKELEKIRAVGGVTAATAHYQMPASTMKYKNIKSTYRLFAINPDDEKQVTVIYKNMLSGKYLKADDKNGIILGAQVSGNEEAATRSFKGIKVGDVVKVALPNNMERDFTVRGIFYSNFIETDYQTFITEKAMRDIAPYLKNQATSILIKIDNPGDESKIIANLKSRGVKGDMHTWKDSAGMMKGISKSFLSIDVLLSLVATLIAAVTIFIVIYVDITNKRSQIGILRALGVRPYLIHMVYVLQSAIYSIAGILVGTAMFFAWLVPYFVSHPFALPIGDAQLVVNYANFVFRAETILVVAVLSGLIPAILVTRGNILDEIRGK